MVVIKISVLIDPTTKKVPRVIPGKTTAEEILASLILKLSDRH